ncbi:hypothetical protein, partial [Lentilactobacillus kefiri]
LKKGTHGWYGASWTGANGTMNMKRSTYRINGKKYAAFYNIDWNFFGKLPKRTKVNVGFHHLTQKAYSAHPLAKGMLQ